jgi:hypothetical protein
MLRFIEWLLLRTGELINPSLLFEVHRGAEVEVAFVRDMDTWFRQWLSTMLSRNKFADPKNQVEAQRIMADPTIFSYGRILFNAGRGGRARMKGMDTLQAAQAASGDLWIKLLDPKLYDGDATWERRNPTATGIVRTITGYAINLAGHYARQIQKRGSRQTIQMSQIDQPNTFDFPLRRGRDDLTDEMWDEIKQRAIEYLRKMLAHLIAEKGEGGAHWQSRVRNVMATIEVVQRQMVLPWTWLDFSEVMREIPRLAPLAGKRGGALQTIIKLATAAKKYALGDVA